MRHVPISLYKRSFTDPKINDKWAETTLAKLLSRHHLWFDPQLRNECERAGLLLPVDQFEGLNKDDYEPLMQGYITTTAEYDLALKDAQLPLEGAFDWYRIVKDLIDGIFLKSNKSSKVTKDEQKLAIGLAQGHLVLFVNGRQVITNPPQSLTTKTQYATYVFSHLKKDTLSLTTHDDVHENAKQIDLELNDTFFSGLSLILSKITLQIEVHSTLLGDEIMDSEAETTDELIENALTNVDVSILNDEQLQSLEEFVNQVKAAISANQKMKQIGISFNEGAKQVEELETESES